MSKIRKSSGKKSRNSAQVKPFLIGMSILLGSFWLANFLTRPPTKPADPKAHHPTVSVAAKAMNKPNAALAPATPGPLPVVVDVPRITGAGLSELGVAVDELGATSFKATIKLRPVCHMGDFEAMEIALGQGGNVLLSLEPMDRESLPNVATVSRMLSLSDIAQGASFDLPVDLKKTAVYGIYVCGDAAGVRSCGGKKAANFNRILNKQDLDQEKNTVFYYQFSVIGLAYATVYTGTADGVPAVREELEKTKGMKGDWWAQMDKVKALMKDVKSIPPTTVRNENIITLEIPIAKLSPEGCP